MKWIASWCALALVFGACGKDEEFEEHKRATVAAFEAEFALYRSVIDAFLAATSAKDYASAYAMLAPSYRNMITREQFAERIATNHNFDKRVAITTHGYKKRSGAIDVEVTWGELGAAHVTFVQTADGSQSVPLIAGITINGTPALPAPP